MTIDVIIPVYRHLTFLPAALTSVARQGVDARVIVVDDGNPQLITHEDMGPDATGMNVVLIRCNERGGIARARNVGLEHCNGETLVFLDADDELQPNALPRLLVSLDGSGVDAAYGYVEEFGNEISQARIEKASRQPVSLAGSTVLRRASVLSLGGFDESLGVGEFIDLMARGLRQGWKTVSVEVPVLRRRIHDANTSWTGKSEDFLRVVRRHVNAAK